MNRASATAKVKSILHVTMLFYNVLNVSAPTAASHEFGFCSFFGGKVSSLKAKPKMQAAIFFSLCLLKALIDSGSHCYVYYMHVTNYAKTSYYKW